MSWLNTSREWHEFNVIIVELVFMNEDVSFHLKKIAIQNTIWLTFLHFYPILSGKSKIFLLQMTKKTCILIYNAKKLYYDYVKVKPFSLFSGCLFNILCVLLHKAHNRSITAFLFIFTMKSPMINIDKAK